MVAIEFLIQKNNQNAGSGLVITGLIVFIFNFGATIGSVTWVYNAEIV